ncbi:galactose-3-O-sulfotransferase 2-like isoform X2 [Watersipora subatra]|uniref:galactose-3-O-sulfotransferase 2-like isoform X2 n=1 Tax=Watersipora subatra TaxID=2589382 RepID=UPI00355B5A5E
MIIGNMRAPCQSPASISNRFSNTKENCEKVHHFVMIKTEKTGSSTLFSILARFILLHQLNIMVTTKGGHLDLRQDRGSKPGWDIGPWTGMKAEALVHHARYNESLLKRMTYDDTKYITLVREAVPWYESAVRFWPSVAAHKSPDWILNTSGKFYVNRTVLGDDYNGQVKLFHLSQLQWLGFDYKYSHDMEIIKDYIKHVVPKFHIGFLTDQFDASLIRLRREFCWQHVDIFYKSQEVGGRKGKVSPQTLLPLSPEGRAKLVTKEFNLGDQMLYESFNQTWWKSPSVMAEDFWEEVSAFKQMNTEVNTACQGITKDQNYTIEGNRWSDPVTLTYTLCALILHENYSLIKKLAQYAIGQSYDQNIYVVRSRATLNELSNARIRDYLAKTL